MSYIKIIFNEDVRKVFKKGEEICFDFKDKPVILITGDNGCGKSTLVNSIRAHKCSNLDGQEKTLGSASLNYSDIELFLKPFTTINTDFKNIFYLSSEFDDPLSMNNSFDACAFINNGGFHTANLSKGQRLMKMFARHIQKYKEKFDEDTLIIFDEADTGYDLKNQIMFYKLLPKICELHKCKCLCITHCAIPLMLGTYNVYDLKNRMYINGKDYLEIYIKTLLN